MRSGTKNISSIFTMGVKEPQLGIELQQTCMTQRTFTIRQCTAVKYQLAAVAGVAHNGVVNKGLSLLKSELKEREKNIYLFCFFVEHVLLQQRPNDRRWQLPGHTGGSHGTRHTAIVANGLIVNSLRPRACRAPRLMNCYIVV